MVVAAADQVASAGVDPAGASVASVDEAAGEAAVGSPEAEEAGEAAVVALEDGAAAHHAVAVASAEDVEEATRRLFVACSVSSGVYMVLERAWRYDWKCFEPELRAGKIDST